MSVGEVRAVEVFCTRCGTMGLEPRYERLRHPLDFDSAVLCYDCQGNGTVFRWEDEAEREGWRVLRVLDEVRS